MTDTDEQIRKKNYVYGDVLRPDLLRVIPPDGQVIGSVGCGTGIVLEQIDSLNRVLVHSRRMRVLR